MPGKGEGITRQAKQQRYVDHGAKASEAANETKWLDRLSKASSQSFERLSALKCRRLELAVTVQSQCL